jgi:hypothetical protein
MKLFITETEQLSAFGTPDCLLTETEKKNPMHDRHCARNLLKTLFL